jgi:GT2 family glycosyltransferase
VKTLYIILPVHNRRDTTEQFINCLNKQKYKNYKLILVDDGSTDDTDIFVKKTLENSVVLYGHGQLWWAGSLQKGFYWILENNISHDDIVLIINDDTMFDENYLSNAISIFNNYNKNILLFSLNYSIQTKNVIDCGVTVDWLKLEFNQSNKMEEINCLSTRGLFINVGDFIKVGGFYPDKLPHYLSDYEFTIRAIKMGLKPIINKDIKIYCDELKTGYNRRSNYKNIKDYFKKYFSPKNMVNPIYFIRFLLLSCPKKYKLINIIRIIIKSIFALAYNGILIFIQNMKKR